MAFLFYVFPYFLFSFLLFLLLFLPLFPLTFSFLFSPFFFPFFFFEKPPKPECFCKKTTQKEFIKLHLGTKS